MREHMRLRVWADLNRPLCLSKTIEKMRGVTLGRIGQESGHEVQQLGNTGSGRCGDKTHWNEMTFTHCLFESVMQLVRRHFTLIKIGCH